MRTRLAPLAALAALLIAHPAMARSFGIGTLAISEAEILDARAQPSIGGPPTVLITLDDKIVAKVQNLRKAASALDLKIMLDGKLLATLPEPLEGDPTISIPGGASVAEAEALAKLISGKEPLRDSLDEAP
jgi:preprotein translocase subunit SecD